MGDGTPKDVMGTIDRLLARRQQFEEWIVKLDAAAAGAPDGVRARVRADYQARLDETLDELRGHQGEIADQLADLRVQQDELVAREREASEALAEAELRHAVGEYDDRHFEKVRKEHDRAAGEARGRLERIASEISRLGDVQALIAPPTPPPAPAPAPRAQAPAPPPQPPAPAPAREPPPAPAAAEPSGAPPGAPRFEPRPPGKGEGPPRTLVLEPEPRPQPAGDELAFLKSVTEETRRPAPKPEPPAATAPAPAGDKSTGARTLRCGECGAMNRPTEWYCEKCGAELAAL
ncbi:MAG TPA: hypothetical protein VLA95_09890 [Gemmatimonadales bacterium]|nr:hypothetical protein [Gemmatimonadales bacterium]